MSCRGEASLADCKLALEQFSFSLLSMPGVTGVGIGEAEFVGQAYCFLTIYTAIKEVGGLPTCVSVTRPDGQQACIMIRTEFQGTLNPE
jgi:hypothetical protein